ncbi:DUF551 domain-containing protein [Escherichia coli]|nr:DUF551 domain-containing protein [Escherichia coli]
MSAITKDRLLTIKQWRETYGPGSNVVLPAEEAEELARIALASLEAEPVGEFYEYKPGDWYQRSVGDKAPKWVPLYATPPVRELQADVAQAIENLKQKLVECNRYNYCADAVKGVEDASRVLALQNQNMSAPITPEAIENAIEYIRSIAFHINEDDYHGKHIAYFMRQALAWLEGHSCSNDRLGKADNQPVRGNQAAESNRGNEWTGNPDIDNAIIMLDRIDTLESCDDDRIEAVKAVLRRLTGNSPVTPDGWISCSERMPDTKTAVLVAVEFDRKGDWRMKWATYIPGHPDANDGWIIPGASWKPSHWMPLPEPPQEVNRG